MSVLSDSLNFRDIGGLPAANGLTRQGVLYRSEGPANFSPAQLEAIRGLGFRAIVDLRSARERDETPHDWQAPDCRWLQLDVNADLRVFGHYGREQLLQGPDPAIAIATMAETYREIVGALMPHWPAIAEALAGGTVPALLNCTAGKDRTGVAIALLLELAGVSRADIVADYMRSEIFSQNLRRSGELEPALMASFGFMPSEAQVDALIGVRAEYMDAAWDEIAAVWGGVDDYFAAAGVDPVAQREIRKVLVA